MTRLGEGDTEIGEMASPHGGCLAVLVLAAALVTEIALVTGPFLFGPKASAPALSSSAGRTAPGGGSPPCAVPAPPSAPGSAG